MRTILRLGLALLVLNEGVPALWATLFPESFYHDFPTPDRAWITLFPPYNEHLTYDFGLVTLQFVVVLGYATIVLHRTLVRTVLLASLLFSAAHWIYHQGHLVAGSDVRVQLVSQLAPIGIGLILLVINERTHRFPQDTDREETEKSKSDAT